MHHVEEGALVTHPMGVLDNFWYGQDDYVDCCMICKWSSWAGFDTFNFSNVILKSERYFLTQQDLHDTHIWIQRGVFSSFHQIPKFPKIRIFKLLQDFLYDIMQDLMYNLADELVCLFLFS